MTIPAQPGLDFDIVLGLQNRDELNIGVGNFWSYFFPVEGGLDHVVEIIRALVTGSGWLKEFRQFGRLVKIELHLPNAGESSVVYVHYLGICIPRIFMRTSILQNTSAKAAQCL